MLLIVGLGNPGPEYEQTRHNAGVWFIDELCRRYNVSLAPDKKFFGSTANIVVGGVKLHLLVPSTFMNRSGQAVGAMANFYKIPTENILVAHDELDIPCGTAKLKKGGGHGGHNGLRDIIKALGNQNGFMRLRIGIDHPGNAREVTNYVLGRPKPAERTQIDAIVDHAADTIELLANGDWQRAQTQLHSAKI
jgi:PTH1 family peptidyl-tRNA hydrolase